MSPKHSQSFTDYAEAARAHDVAISLRWITRLRFTVGLWQVEYIGKLFP